MKSPRSKKLTLATELSQILINSITTYFTTLSTLQYKQISKNLVDKFAENKKRVKMKYLTNVFQIYSKKYRKKGFNKWKAFLLKKDYDAILDKINSSSHFGVKKVRYNSARTTDKKINGDVANNNFLNRQEKLIQKAKENKQQVANRQEEELKLLYTFSPKVNNSTSFTKKLQNDFMSNNSLSPISKASNVSSVKKMNAFERLYKNSPKKNKSINQYNSNINNYENKRPKTTKKRKGGLEKLYKDYKEYENKKKNLQKEIDMERGLTFKPKSFTSNSGYNVESNFEERNRKLLEDRNNFVFVYDYLRQCKFNEHVLGNGNKLLKNYLVQNNNDIENLVLSQRIANEMLINNNNNNQEEEEAEEEHEENIAYNSD